MTRISLCVIARDEEQMLPGLLASVRGAVDEAVVVDTGSRDRTRDLARQAGARLAEVRWSGFADARNAALALATGDWVLVLDADERLAAGAARALRDHAERGTEPAGMLRLHNAARPDASEPGVLSGADRLGDPVWLARFLRRTPDLRFEGKVHEHVERWHAARGFAAAWLGADVVHLGGAADLRRARGKDDRNLALLRERCAEETDSVTPFGYLALELLARGALDEGWTVAERGWALVPAQPGWRKIQRLAIARGLLALRRGEALVAEACATEGKRRDGPAADFHLLRGWALERIALSLLPASGDRRKLLEAALASDRAALALAGQPSQQSILTGATTFSGHTRAGTVLLALGHAREALESFGRALAAKPDHVEARRGVEEARAALDRAGPRRPIAVKRARGSGNPLWGPDAHEPPSRSMRAEERGSGVSTAVASSSQRWAVTVVSPRGFAHSAAFAEVAESLVWAFGALGHDAVPSTDPSLPGRRHLVLGANLLPPGAVLPPGTVLYNLEQIERGSDWLTPALLDLYRRYEVWDYSGANASALADLGLPRPRILPIAYAPVLTRIAPAPEEDVDVLFYGSLNERRARVLRELRRRGARVHVAYGVYGGERDALIARSKLVLNVHFYEAKVFEVVRVSYLLANRRCVVSERGRDPAESQRFEGGVAFAGQDELVDRCLDLLARPEERARIAENGFRCFTGRSIAGELARVLGPSTGGGVAGRGAPAPPA